MKLRVFSRSGGALKKYLNKVTTDFDKFLSWLPLNEWVAHDLETTFASELYDRTMQVATYYYDNTAWVIFVEELTPVEMKKLADVMCKGQFICQGVKFEIKEWMKYDVEMRKFYDTMLAEKLLNMGKEFAKADLASIVKKYTDVDMSKELQTSFVNNATITDEQLRYAVLDVVYLHLVKKVQEETIGVHDQLQRKTFKQLGNRGLKTANFFNHEFIRVVADMEYYGIRIDDTKWRALYDKALPLLNAAVIRLNNIVKRDFYTRAAAEGFLYAEDTFHPKLLTSTANKIKLFGILHPGIEKISQLELKKYLMEHDPNWPSDLKPTSKYVNAYLSKLGRDSFIDIKLFLLGEEESLKKLFSINFREKLIELGIMYPKDSMNINWASPVQRKTIFQWVAPKLESTDRDHLEEVAYIHEIIAAYLEDYQVNSGKVSKFGLGYLDHVESDGVVRTNVNPIINTGRISSSSPNILNIINDKEYRAAFITAPGHSFVMTDYQGQELNITAQYSNEQLWIDAIKAGHDIHSINAANIYKSKWTAGTLADCRFVSHVDKCKCPIHKDLRQKAKAIEFGKQKCVTFKYNTLALLISNGKNAGGEFRGTPIGDEDNPELSFGRDTIESATTKNRD